MKLYVSVPLHNEDFDYAVVAAAEDGVVLMNYDEHYPGGELRVRWHRRNGSSRT